MSPRRRLRPRLGRLVKGSWPGLAVVGSGAWIATSGFRGILAGSVDVAQVAMAAALGVVLVAKLAGYLRRLDAGTPYSGQSRRRAELRHDLELGGLLLVATFAVVQATGGGASPLYPLLYALVAFLVAFHRLAVGVVLVGFALVLELALFLGDGAAPEGRGRLGAHLGFLAFFAVVHYLFLRAELWRQRREHRRRLDAEVARLRQEARDFRLISSQLGADSRGRTRAEEEDKLAQGAVETIHQALFYILELVRRSAAGHTAVLLWLDESGERLTIKELCSEAEAVHEGSIGATDGAPGMVVKSRAPLALAPPKLAHMPYYDSAEAIGALLCAPVLEEGHLRGVLCVDRLAGPGCRPFDEGEAELLAGAASQIVRAVQSERVFAAVERAKYEHERFYRASEQLNRALTPDQVFATAFQAAREIGEFDFASITLFDRETRRHTIVAVSGDCGEAIEGQSFQDNAGLAAMVVKNKHYLPAGGEPRSSDVPVYTKRIKLRGMESLLVLPLICADEAIGSFTLASKRRGQFLKDKREMLGVIANQVAVSVKNAEMYRAMENLATTDGLTGLINHRTFQERFADLLMRAERHQGKLAVLLTDVDHFKKVNDNHGHPVGDQVLKRVAAVCKEEVRKIDLAARYGGEEFAILLDGTDRDGARLLAERIRKQVAAQSFSSDKGPFGCTISIGIAAFPDDGRDPKSLISHADQALYHAKHNGRNRAVAWPDVHGAAVPVQPIREARSLRAVR